MLFRDKGLLNQKATIFLLGFFRWGSGKVLRVVGLIRTTLDR